MIIRTRMTTFWPITMKKTLYITTTAIKVHRNMDARIPLELFYWSGHLQFILYSYGGVSIAVQPLWVCMPPPKVPMQSSREEQVLAILLNWNTAWMHSRMHFMLSCHSFLAVKWALNCRYFYFCLRWYNYDPSKDEFIPGYWDMGNTVRELLDSQYGLHAPDVEERKQEIGPNSLRMKNLIWFRLWQKNFLTCTIHTKILLSG